MNQVIFSGWKSVCSHRCVRVPISSKYVALTRISSPVDAQASWGLLVLQDWNIDKLILVVLGEGAVDTWGSLWCTGASSCCSGKPQRASGAPRRCSAMTVPKQRENVGTRRLAGEALGDHAGATRAGRGTGEIQLSLKLPAAGDGCAGEMSLESWDLWGPARWGWHPPGDLGTALGGPYRLFLPCAVFTIIHTAVNREVTHSFMPPLHKVRGAESLQ